MRSAKVNNIGIVGRDELIYANCFLICAEQEEELQHIPKLNCIITNLKMTGIRVISDHSTAGLLGASVCIDTSTRISLRHPEPVEFIIVIGTAKLVEKYKSHNPIRAQLELLHVRVIQENNIIMQNDLLECQRSVLPLIFEESIKESMPSFLNEHGNQLVYMNFATESKTFAEQMQTLINTMYCKRTVFQSVKFTFSYISYAKVISNLPRHPSFQNYYDRTNLSSNLDNILSPNAVNNIADTKILLISGVEGVGKTLLAINFAHRNIKNYQLIWYIRNSHMGDDYKELAQILGIESVNDSPDFLRHAVHQFLRSFPDWLLIYDNILDINFFSSMMLTQGLIGAHGHILITSRHAVKGINCHLNMEPLSDEEAVEFVLYLTNQDAKIDAEKLVARKGVIPVILARAAAYIMFYDKTIAEYNETLLKNSLELQKREEQIFQNQLGDFSNKGSVTLSIPTSLQAVTSYLEVGNLITKTAAHLLTFNNK